MGTVIERLLRQSHLFDDPSAYEAGVRDTLEALARATDAQDPSRSLGAPLSRSA